MANFSDRSLLKNLGHWLGMITLAKNKPILLDDIDLKMLLVEAYNKGHQELLFTVPFIAKILESCAKSKVYYFFLFSSINLLLFYLLLELFYFNCCRYLNREIPGQCLL